MTRPIEHDQGTGPASSCGPQRHVGPQPMIVTHLNGSQDALTSRIVSRVAFIGNSLPRRCGIATFTNDLQQAVAASRPSIETAIVAMSDHGQTYEFGPAVRFEVGDQNVAEYLDAAQFLNDGEFDLVCLQHEFGIFGGLAGELVLAMLSRLKIPIVTTFHTILSDPTSAQRRVMDEIARLSEKVVAMSEKGREILRATYRIPAEKIAVIPHGVPDFGFVEPDAAKAKLGFAGQSVILTFGLLAPSKGVDLIIEAMPSILQRRPDATYIVLGATHPNLVRYEGEVYRNGLMARARELNVEDKIVFLDQFVDQAMLLDYISMCDVYVTPYRNEAQMTSGTLAYSFGLGKAVVSTPYWHAIELLADGGGILVPFGDTPAMGHEIADLLTNAPRRLALRQRAYSSSRAMTWPQTAKLYLSLFDSVQLREQLARVEPRLRRPTERIAMPEVRMDHFMSMCDDTGLLQHAIHSIPDRSHGYCIDDNARALLLACTLDHASNGALPEAMTARFAAFVQHAWNPDTARFRNFMSFDRRWLEESGSEDSHGRGLWALGVCSAGERSPSRQVWAEGLFARAFPAVETFSSPRAWAFALLGLEPYCAAHPEDSGADRLRRLLATRLFDLLSTTETKDWPWFENVLAYDNARLPQALILTGRSTGTLAHVEAGLRSLRWLVTIQMSPQGLFRPVGSDSFGNKRSAPALFDQQPVEATATISACLAAWAADGDDDWRIKAETVFEWFLGRNDLGLPLVHVPTGSCRDGLHPDRANENRGGESVVSYLLSVVELRAVAALDRIAALPRPKVGPNLLHALSA